MHNTTNVVGMSFLSWLGLLFIALKLTGYITWSWWWVLAPFWIGWVIVLGILIGIGIAMFAVAAVAFFSGGR